MKLCYFIFETFRIIIGLLKQRLGFRDTLYSVRYAREFQSNFKREKIKRSYIKKYSFNFFLAFISKSITLERKQKAKNLKQTTTTNLIYISFLFTTNLIYITFVHSKHAYMLHLSEIALTVSSATIHQDIVTDILNLFINNIK